LTLKVDYVRPGCSNLKCRRYNR